MEAGEYTLLPRRGTKVPAIFTKLPASLIQELKSNPEEQSLSFHIGSQGGEAGSEAYLMVNGKKYTGMLHLEPSTVNVAKQALETPEFLREHGPVTHKFVVAPTMVTAADKKSIRQKAQIADIESHKKRTLEAPGSGIAEAGQSRKRKATAPPPSTSAVKRARADAPTTSSADNIRAGVAAATERAELLRRDWAAARLSGAVSGAAVRGTVAAPSTTATTTTTTTTTTTATAGGAATKTTSVTGGGGRNVGTRVGPGGRSGLVTANSGAPLTLRQEAIAKNFTLEEQLVHQLALKPLSLNELVVWPKQTDQSVLMDALDKIATFRHSARFMLKDSYLKGLRLDGQGAWPYSAEDLKRVRKKVEEAASPTFGGKGPSQPLLGSTKTVAPAGTTSTTTTTAATTTTTSSSSSSPSSASARLSDAAGQKQQSPGGGGGGGGVGTSSRGVGPPRGRLPPNFARAAPAADSHATSTVTTAMAASTTGQPLSPLYPQERQSLAVPVVTIPQLPRTQSGGGAGQLVADSVVAGYGSGGTTGVALVVGGGTSRSGTGHGAQSLLVDGGSGAGGPATRLSHVVDGNAGGSRLAASHAAPSPSVSTTSSSSSYASASSSPPPFSSSSSTPAHSSSSTTSTSSFTPSSAVASAPNASSATTSSSSSSSSASSSRGSRPTLSVDVSPWDSESAMSGSGSGPLMSPTLSSHRIMSRKGGYAPFPSIEAAVALVDVLKKPYVVEDYIEAYGDIMTKEQLKSYENEYNSKFSLHMTLYKELRANEEVFRQIRARLQELKDSPEMHQAVLEEAVFLLEERRPVKEQMQSRYTQLTRMLSHVKGKIKAYKEQF